MKLDKTEVVKITHELHEKLSEVYGDRMREVYLYGSYARDQADEDSDIDIAVVLSGSVNRAEERARVSGIASDISLRYNCLITLFFMSEDDLKSQPYAVHRSIAREGVAV
ncbi:hypothetical protein MNBD_NITROSPINAE03-46 [hydrothermal vent metagenome]|uniref:Polymerase nucleotidyl transferase domain-containing protein n=1 Tax=hydrothermal vent metagenome TaxID=652676 RepID=A0A3B1CZE7_9ZZZZ